MKHTAHPIQKMSIFAHLKLHSTALANLLVAIVTLLSVAHGLMISSEAAHMSAWCLMGVITLLMLMLAVNYTDLVKRIPILKRSLNGGKLTYTEHSKNYE
jgi:uncharacterized membrane protein